MHGDISWFFLGVVDKESGETASGEQAASRRKAGSLG